MWNSDWDYDCQNLHFLRLFFLRRRGWELKSHTQSSTESNYDPVAALTQTLYPGAPLHLGTSLPVSGVGRRSNRDVANGRATASQDATPTARPMPRSLSWPAASDLRGQDHQACLTSLTCEFGVRPLLPEARVCCGLTHPDGKVTLVATKSAHLPHFPACVHQI